VAVPDEFPVSFFVAQIFRVDCWVVLEPAVVGNGVVVGATPHDEWVAGEGSSDGCGFSCNLGDDGFRFVVFQFDPEVNEAVLFGFEAGVRVEVVFVSECAPDDYVGSGEFVFWVGY